MNSVGIPECECTEVGSSGLDDGNIAGLVGCEQSIDDVERAVREFDDGGGTLRDDVIVGYDEAVLAYEETAALATGLPFLSDMMIETTAPLAALAIAGMSFRVDADCGGVQTH